MEYMVTIACTTYNLEKYISQAIESWLMQETTFPVEILISDDGSTDKTIDIIRSYMLEHSNITLLCNQHMGMMPNFLYSIQQSSGKYIALCDGDDYWIDPLKLQKQFDFMESHLDYSACFTNSWVINENTGEKKIAKTQLWDTADGLGLLAHRDDDNIQMSPGHTSTYFFRNGLIKKFPGWMYDDIMTDFPLYMLMSQYGKAKFINDIATVYRASRLGSDSNSNWSYEKSWRQRIRAYDYVNKELKYKYKEVINPIIAEFYFKLTKLLWKQYRKKDSIICFFQSMKADSTVVMRWLREKCS